MTDENQTSDLNKDDFEVDPNETAESHDEDVDEALKRETQDGKGGAVVPKEPAFQSYATDDVEVDDKDENQEK